MKRNGLSSIRRSKTKMGACAQDRSGFVPSAASAIRWRARRAQLSVARLLVGGLATTLRVEAQSGKVAREERALKKDVKNEGRSDYVYENKDAHDNLSVTN